MIPFDEKEWKERIEAVKDSMAIYLKAEYGFEVNTEVYVERGGRGDTMNADIDIAGNFTNLTTNTVDGAPIAAILKDYPYKDVVTFMNNIYAIEVDTRDYPDDALRILDIPTNEEGRMWAWSGLDFYEVHEDDGSKEAEEIKEILAKYAPIVKDKLTNWLNNIRHEYIVKLSKEYWELREESFASMCEKGDIFN